MVKVAGSRHCCCSLRLQLGLVTCCLLMLQLLCGLASWCHHRQWRSLGSLWRAWPCAMCQCCSYYSQLPAFI